MQEQIFEALRRGAHDEALAGAQAAVKADPRGARPLLWLAMASRALGRDDDALTAIDRAIALAPEDADLHFHRAGLLLGRRDIGAAQSALSTSVALDPNQFGAYILQAQLALARGDLDEAERLHRLAARLAPEHPWCRAVEGMVALRRGEHDRALSLLSQASAQAPEDAQVLQALGFAYLAKGHFAFAEQAFRRLLDRSPGADALRTLLAQVVYGQGRPGDALDALAPLVDAPAQPTPALLRQAGRLALEAGRDAQALPWLRAALAAMPEDPATVALAMEAWRRGGDPDDARNALDAALATAPQAAELWRARLSLERVDGDAAAALVERWTAAMPGHVPALEARMQRAAMLGDAAAAEAAAREIVEIEPGRASAHGYLIDRQMARDPAAAVAHVEDLLAKAQADDRRRLLRHWLGLAQDAAGLYAQAAETWTALNAEAAPQRLPLLDPAPPSAVGWPPLGEPADPAPATLFLYGPPGSRVEQLGIVLQTTVQAFRADRFGPSPPQDLLQNYHTPRRLASGELGAAEVADSWRAQLSARGLDESQTVDWLLWWDNSLLRVLRECFPHASLLLALRDPRDMLLDWLAFGAPAPLRIQSPKTAAAWLSIELNQLVHLHEDDLFPHHLVKLDQIATDAPALVAAASEALRTPLPDVPAAAFGPKRFPPGHWRRYAEALAEPFAMLAPVAKRLGYPET